MRSRRLSLAERRARIVTAAERCFARRGFSGTTTRMLARAAGVSEALVYRHFPTKRSLYGAIVERKLGGRGRSVFPAVAGGDERRVLRDLAAGLMERVDSDPDFLRLLLFSRLEGNDFSRIFVSARGTSVHEELTAFLAERMKAGRLRRLDPATAARAFLGIVFHHLQVRHLFRLPVGRLRGARLVEAWVDIFLRGIGR